MTINLPNSFIVCIFSRQELLGRATFAWSLYEHSLLRALQDLLSATVLLPGFAQVSLKTLLKYYTC